MELDIYMNLDNAAFDENPSVEVARVLFELSQDIKTYGLDNNRSIRDINGNTIGHTKLTV